MILSFEQARGRNLFDRGKKTQQNQTNIITQFGLQQLFSLQQDRLVNATTFSRKLETWVLDLLEYVDVIQITLVFHSIFCVQAQNRKIFFFHS